MDAAQRLAAGPDNHYKFINYFLLYVREIKNIARYINVALCVMASENFVLNPFFRVLQVSNILP